MKILMVLAALLATLVLTACGGGSPAEETATTVPTMAEGNPTPGATLSPDETDDDMPTDEEIAEMLSNIDPIQVAQEWASGGPGRNTMVDIGRLIKSADGKCDYGTTPELCHGIWQLFLNWGVGPGSVEEAIFQTARDTIVLEIEPTVLERTEFGGLVKGTATGEFNIGLRGSEGNIREAYVSYTLPFTLDVFGDLFEMDSAIGLGTLDFQWVEGSTPQELPSVALTFPIRDEFEVLPYLSLIEAGESLEFSFQVVGPLEGNLTVAVIDPEGNEVYRSEEVDQGAGTVVAPTRGQYTLLLEHRNPHQLVVRLGYRVLPPGAN